MAFDTLIKGGTVYDGEHAEPTVQDIGIKDGVITALGHLSEKRKKPLMLMAPSSPQPGSIYTLTMTGR